MKQHRHKHGLFEVCTALLVSLSWCHAGCQESPAPGASTSATKANDTDSEPVTPKEKLPARTLDLSFDDVKFEMEKTAAFDRSMITPTIEQYEGRSIRIRGYILPSFKQDGLTEFILVRDNMECCFGPGAALYDCIMIRMQPGKSTSFSVRPVTVEGKFRIEEWRDFDNVVRAIYHMEGQQVY